MCKFFKVEIFLVVDVVNFFVRIVFLDFVKNYKNFYFGKVCLWFFYFFIGCFNM